MDYPVTDLRNRDGVDPGDLFFEPVIVGMVPVFGP
jgi:hypothetical protein